MSILIGTCSWTDRTLLTCGRFYPRSTMSAEERLRFYASRYPTVEVDSSFYGMPSERNSHLWVERTPSQFVFNIKAYKTLTGHDRSRAATEDEWRDFRGALKPLQDARKLGYILFQFPPWFRPNPTNWAYLRQCRDRMPDFELAVQFRHDSWVTGDYLEETVQLLNSERMHYVSVDEPQLPSSHTMPPLSLVTAGLGIVRFNGRNRANWYAKNIEVVERFHYRYESEELAAWADQVRQIHQQAGQVFVMFNNCFEDDAAVNARQMAVLLGIPLGPDEDQPIQQRLF